MGNVGLSELLVILIIIGALWVPMIFYIVTLQSVLRCCSPQNRTLSPGLVWLLLIPFVNLIWHFVIVINMAKSLHAEFTMRNIVEARNPGQAIGLSVSILSVTSLIPFLGILTGVAAFICWIIYWVKIAGLSNKLKPQSGSIRRGRVTSRQ